MNKYEFPYYRKDLVKSFRNKKNLKLFFITPPLSAPGPPNPKKS